MQKIRYCFCSQWFIGFLLCFVILLSLESCSYNQVLIKDADAVFKQDVGFEAAFNQYWQLMAEKEVKKTFMMEAPYIRDMVSVDRYRLYKKLFLKGNIKEVKVLGLKCDQPFRCCVDCQITYTVKGRSDVRELQDCWVWVKSGWYHIFESPLFFPM